MKKKDNVYNLNPIKILPMNTNQINDVLIDSLKENQFKVSNKKFSDNTPNAIVLEKEYIDNSQYFFIRVVIDHDVKVYVFDRVMILEYSSEFSNRTPTNLVTQFITSIK
jgi:hypothetical protein